MIRLGQLHEFNEEITKQIFEEKKEKYRWEYFLHKVYDRSYEEFLNGVGENTETSMTEDEIKNVIQNSESILDLF